MNGRAWSSDELETVRINYADWPTFLIAHLVGRDESSVYRAAHMLGLRKSAKYLSSEWACRLRRGDEVGKNHRYPKGHVPANKGTRRPGYAPGRMAATQFKPGTRQGRAAKVYKQIGTQRLSKDGYLERKINEDLPFQRRWRAVHILLWEEHLGPLPAGFCICFKNRDKADIRIDNLGCISRAERMRRNTIHRYPPALKEAIRLVGRVRRQIRKNNENENRGSEGTPVRNPRRSARSRQSDGDRPSESHC